MEQKKSINTTDSVNMWISGFWHLTSKQLQVKDQQNHFDLLNTVALYKYKQLPICVVKINI